MFAGDVADALYFGGLADGLLPAIMNFHGGLIRSSRTGTLACPPVGDGRDGQERPVCDPLAAALAPLHVPVEQAGAARLEFGIGP